MTNHNLCVATTEYWNTKIKNGCDNLWTDFGSPMCNIGANMGQCFIGASTILKCPIDKITIQEESDDSVGETGRAGT